MSAPHLFCFGLGYSAQALIRRLAPRGWTISGTNRNGDPVTGCANLWTFDGTAALPREALDRVTHLLISIPPGDSRDPVLECCTDELAQRAAQFAWIGYLSTTGVYGDRGGGWVDEDAPLTPLIERGKRRLAAETSWIELYETSGASVHLFRLAGIYGPGRNQLVSVLDGTAKRIVKAGQVFSRIHVDDIAGALDASIARPASGRAYNICDDEPCPPADVVAYAARLLGREPPPEISFEQAALSPMAASFYAESKRVSNRRMKAELGYRLLYPTYREGLAALVENMNTTR